MKKNLVKAIVMFVLVITFGILYIAVMGEHLSFFAFSEYNTVIHAILYATATICTVLVLTRRKE